MRKLTHVKSSPELFGFLTHFLKPKRPCQVGLKGKHIPEEGATTEIAQPVKLTNHVSLIGGTFSKASLAEHNACEG